MESYCGLFDYCKDSDKCMECEYMEEGELVSGGKRMICAAFAVGIPALLAIFALTVFVMVFLLG
jgi:hypothetical protein